MIGAAAAMFLEQARHTSRVEHVPGPRRGRKHIVTELIGVLGASHLPTGAVKPRFGR